MKKSLLQEYVKETLRLISEVKKPDLQSGTMLGYAGEQAVYAGLGSPLSKNQLETNLKNDSRIKKLYASSQQSEEGKIDWEEFVNAAEEMKNSVVKRFSEMGLAFVRPPSPPGGGTEEYDIVATGSSLSGRRKVERTFNIHVKYKSDRLVGIPQPKVEKIRNPKTGKIDKEATEKAAEEAAAGNPSVIYKRVRDAFLFKSGVEGGTGCLELGDRGGPLVDGILTSNGKVVRNVQLTSDSAPSEIAVIINTPKLRDKLFGFLTSAGFDDVISSSIKKQLGLEVKGDEKRPTMFVNFTGKDVQVQKFSPDQGEIVEFSLVPGEKTSSAFTITTSFPDFELPEVFNVELGSIVRAKYVQIHKGKNFKKFIELLEGMSE
jgi:hypothetical protein